MRPFYTDSKILVTREIIRKSKSLNQLLYHNVIGLRMLYAEKKIWRRAGAKMDQFVGHFNLTSCINLASGLIQEEGLLDLRECFVYSQ